MTCLTGTNANIDFGSEFGGQVNLMNTITTETKPNIAFIKFTLAKLD